MGTLSGEATLSFLFCLLSHWGSTLKVLKKRIFSLQNGCSFLEIKVQVLLDSVSERTVLLSVVSNLLSNRKYLQKVQINKK